MKRDWDVIRKILLKIELLPTDDSQVDSTEFEDRGIPNEVAAYHMALLQEAGIIEGGGRKGSSSPYRFAFRLTWQGHELLDQIRRDTVWAAIKARLMQSGVDASVEAVRLAASSLLKQMLD